jgi:ABC-type multidrug transport system ATPase subunit
MSSPTSESAVEIALARPTASGTPVPAAEKEPGDSAAPAPGGVSVEIKDLTIRAGSRTLLEGAAARFEPGQVTLIVGPSGAGKSTLLRLLAGLLGEGDEGILASGCLEIDGREVSTRVRRRSLGVVFQSHALFDELSPLANVRLAEAHRRRQRLTAGREDSPQALLRELRVPHDVRTSALSGGQRQRLAIARTIANDPDVILYDEPTTGLDAATAGEVASLIRSTHASHPKTSIVVTHDYEALAPIADRIYLLDPRTRSLREIKRDQWQRLRDELSPVAQEETDKDGLTRAAKLTAQAGKLAVRVGDVLAATTRTVEQTLLTPLALLPVWRHPLWGSRFLGHYLRLVAGPSAWAYLAISGIIIGYVTTYFTFRFLPYAGYTKPLLIEDLLMSMGFALYRILVPVLSTILVAARCGAAVASDVGGKSYGRQLDALRTLGVSPRGYLLTPILYSFLLGVPLLTLIGYATASLTSLVVFSAAHPDRGPDFWQLYFHWRLDVPQQFLFLGTWWLLSKLLLCALGIGLIAYHRGARPKHSHRDVSDSITSTILWSTLYVLTVHFAFAFFEFE